MPRGPFLSWVTKNRAAYREQRPLAGYAEAARGRPKVKESKEVAGNRFRLVEARAPARASTRRNATFPGLLCLPAIKENTGFKNAASGRALSRVEKQLPVSAARPESNKSRPLVARPTPPHAEGATFATLTCSSAGVGRCRSDAKELLAVISRCQAGATPGGGLQLAWLVIRPRWLRPRKGSYSPGRVPSGTGPLLREAAARTQKSGKFGNPAPKKNFEESRKQPDPDSQTNENPSKSRESGETRNSPTAKIQEVRKSRKAIRRWRCTPWENRSSAENFRPGPAKTSPQKNR